MLFFKCFCCGCCIFCCVWDWLIGICFKFVCCFGIVGGIGGVIFVGGVEFKVGMFCCCWGCIIFLLCEFFFVWFLLNWLWLWFFFLFFLGLIRIGVNFFLVKIFKGFSSGGEIVCFFVVNGFELIIFCIILFVFCIF